ncbi:MAG: hypothetical protein LBG92_09070 [Prevotellaceae bacterium]|jgi:hypothetical protein|nr:hypothetical protein [Prevotellaceae bacterium]
MRIFPDKQAKSVEDIANYIMKKFSSNSAKLRAAYSWTAQHISYDIDELNNRTTYKNENELIERTLRTRKSVCSGYTKTFKAIAEKLGLNVQEISGYVKQNGKIDEDSHAWCAVKIAGKWKLIDPTWSAGTVSQGQFRKRFNDKWFLVEPGKIINSHMPFDPVWQFSYFPINHKEFYTDKVADSITSRFFNFPDTINKISMLSEKERIIASNRRIISMGIYNSATEKHIEINIKIIKSIQESENVEKYNLAVNLYNQSCGIYNSYIKNQKNSVLKKKLNEANLKLYEALQYLNGISLADREMLSSVEKLKNMVHTLISDIKKIS